MGFRACRNTSIAGRYCAGNFSITPQVLMCKRLVANAHTVAMRCNGVSMLIDLCIFTGIPLPSYKHSLTLPRLSRVVSLLSCDM